MCPQPPSPRRRRTVARTANRPSRVLQQPRPKGQSAKCSCHTRNKQVTARERRKRTKEPQFGHGPGEVPKESFRIGLLNVDNLSPWGNNDKDARLCNFLRDYQIEACLTQEVGVKWNEMRRKSQWSRRCAKHFEPSSMQARFGFNEHNPSGSPRQWGGTGVTSLGKLKHYSMGSGTDESGLGRWTWAQH